MSPLQPEKLHVKYKNVSEDIFSLPRKYTLTHSDRTGELFLTIASECDFDQISHWYIKLMRDEVLGEWIKKAEQYELHLQVHISGGLIFGWARMRDKIIRSHLPLVCETIRYAERELINANSFLDSSPIIVHFNSHRKKYNKVEKYSILKDFRL